MYKKIFLLLLICICTKLFAQKEMNREIRMYAGVNTAEPKENMYGYKADMDIEGGLSVLLSEIKYSKNLSLKIEPMLKLKRYSMEAISIMGFGYRITSIDVGVRLYPFQNKILKNSTKNKILGILGNILYTDIAYSKVKFVKVNVPIDVVRKMLSWGYGISTPILRSNELGFNAKLILNAGVNQYKWKNASGSTSSFAGKSISLTFAVELGSKK